MNAFVFPQPGERTNAAAIPVPVDVLTWLASAAGALYLLEACRDETCETCAHKTAVWLEVVRLLPADTLDAVGEAAQTVSAALRREMR